MKRFGTVVLLASLAGVVMIAASAAMPTASGLSATVHAAPAAGPDLVVSDVELVGLAKPHPYLLIDDTGLPQRFSVRVVTTNLSKTVAAGPSVTSLLIVDVTTQRKLVNVRLNVPRLGPGKSSPPSVVPASVASRIRPHLGFVLIHAQADATGKFREPNEANNRYLSDGVPVVAYRWNAVRWSVDAALPGFEHRTELDPGSTFFFRFKRYSDALEQFQYEAVGGIQDTGRFDACGAPQTAKASHDPWPDGGLTINRSLTSYEGELASSKESPWTFTCSAVPGMTAPAQLFQNMDTLEGSKQRPRMKPSDIRLMGAGNGPNAIYDWDFQADVPSH